MDTRIGDRLVRLIAILLVLSGIATGTVLVIISIVARWPL